jgi:hypothetical protein
VSKAHFDIDRANAYSRVSGATIPETINGASIVHTALKKEMDKTDV